MMIMSTSFSISTLTALSSSSCTFFLSLLIKW